MKLKKNIALSESGFVFDPSTGDSYSLNEQALDIVRMMNEESTVEEITDYMTETYDVDRASFEKYYFDFVGMLRQNRLLEENE
ncbi:MAG: PqqD family protein [Bacteroidales bacterium]